MGTSLRIGTNLQVDFEVERIFQIRLMSFL